MVVNTSLAALAALHGLDVPLDPAAPVDRDRIRALYTSPVSTVTRVSRPWRRAGRRFVQISLAVADQRRLSEAPPFAWARYTFAQQGEVIEFVQEWGPSAAKDVGNVGWDGQELVAVRLHIPSRVTHHNTPSRLIERGNILAWEQPLASRLAGDPLRVEVRFGVQRILVLTVALFLAVVMVATIAFGMGIDKPWRPPP